MVTAELFQKTRHCCVFLCTKALKSVNPSTCAKFGQQAHEETAQPQMLTPISNGDHDLSEMDVIGQPRTGITQIENITSNAMSTNPDQCGTGEFEPNIILIIASYSATDGGLS